MIRDVISKNKVIKIIINLSIVVVIGVIMFAFGIRTVKAKGNSMEPTIKNGDVMVMHNIFYIPKQGDIVVFQNGDTIYIKRIIAIEEQKVKLEDNGDHTYSLYINNSLIIEKYISEVIDDKHLGNMTLEEGSTVPKDHVFILGDNRNGSIDSRDEKFGFIKTKDILGKVLVRIFPLNNIAVL
jgi:signal peptidase I